MRVMTWNTYQATTMPYRHLRRPGLFPALDYFSHHNIDVVCLQEQNSTRFGPVSYCLWSVCLLLPAVLRSCAMEVIEYLGVLEGLFLPLCVVDNKTDVIQYAARHTRFKFAAAVPPPRYFFDCGLIILSAHPIDAASTQCIHLRRDAGNRPGLLAVNVTVSPPASSSSSSSSSSSRPLRLRVYNVHFVPSLLDVNPVFRVLNFINARLGRDTRQLRSEHFSVLMAEVRRWQEKDPELLTVIAGDLNVTRGSEEERRLTRVLQQQAGLLEASMRPQLATACERTFGHEGQIDYILVDQRVMQRWKQFTGDRAAPPLRCACTSDGTEGEADAQHAGDVSPACRCGNVEHVWPEHEDGELHSTRVNTMWTSDHYPLMADLPFLQSR
jgi:endonuclease/exonuclease/phosphatase family metal-dependent hydrolase